MTRLCLQRVSKKNRKTKEKHRNSAGYESRTGVVKERPGIDVGGLFRGLLPSSDSVQFIKPCLVRVVLCLSRGWIVSEKKAKQNYRHRNSASIAGQPDQSSSGGGAVKTETRVLRRVVLYRLPSSCVCKSLNVRGSVTSSSGELRVVRSGGIHRLYG